jgi:hypothetical protein
VARESLTIYPVDFPDALVDLVDAIADLADAIADLADASKLPENFRTSIIDPILQEMFKTMDDAYPGFEELTNPVLEAVKNFRTDKSIGWSLDDLAPEGSSGLSSYQFFKPVDSVDFLPNAVKDLVVDKPSGWCLGDFVPEGSNGLCLFEIFKPFEAINVAVKSNKHFRQALAHHFEPKLKRKISCNAVGELLAHEVGAFYQRTIFVKTKIESRVRTKLKKYELEKKRLEQIATVKLQIREEQFKLLKQFLLNKYGVHVQNRCIPPPLVLFPTIQPNAPSL